MGQTYILLGPEKGRKEDFIKKIKDSIGECDVGKFYAFEEYEEEMFAQLNNNDLFAPHKLVILDEAQEVKTKDKVKPIVGFIKNPSDCATFILCSTELYINAEIMGAIPNQKENIVKFYELFESQKSDWISDFFRRKGLAIQPAAVSAVIEKVENNIQEFESVCNQMAIYVGGVEGKKTITYEDVEEFLTHTRPETEFTLFSYIARMKLDSSIECLHALLHTTDVAGVAATLSVRLASYFRRVLSIEMNLANMSIDEAMKAKFFDTDRPITMPKDKDIYKAAVSNYKQRDIERILVTLAEYDIKIKEAGVTLQQTVMEKLLVDIIVHKGKHTKKIQFAKF